MKRNHNEESLSGPGSHIKNTKEAVDIINRTIASKQPETILDLGCGDWNWFKLIELGSCYYQGWDCDEQMIADNRKLYNRDFRVKDIVTEAYPKVDLIICRDVLFHLPKDMSMQVIDKIKKSSKYFISTTFKNTRENRNINNYAKIDGWGYYQINLDIEPFNLKDYEIDTIYEPAMRRYISVYEW
jgi:SAM-dependent methyltransferase